MRQRTRLAAPRPALTMARRAGRPAVKIAGLQQPRAFDRALEDVAIGFDI